MTSRYSNRNILTNQTQRYKEVREERNVKVLYQYESPNLYHPKAEELDDVSVRHEIWSVGSRLYKYAAKYYGDARYWWIIAWYNQKPTEADFQIGDVVEIPLPLEEIFRVLKL